MTLALHHYVYATGLAAFGFGFTFLLLYGVFGNPGVRGEYIHPTTYSYIYAISVLVGILLLALLLVIFTLSH